jgi:hypothetical protein
MPRSRRAFLNVKLRHVKELDLVGPEPMKELLTPKFGKESDLWVRFDKESV